MVRLSCGRRFYMHSLWMGPAALAAFLVLAVPNPAAGSPVPLRGNPEAHIITAAIPPTLAAPSDTDWSSDSVHLDRRANWRGGYVVTDEQLELEQDFPLSSVLIAHIPGIRVVRGPQFDRVVSGIHVSIKGDPCYVQMFIDGVFVADGDVNMVSVRDLASIEYRTPGNIPVQFQNQLQGAPCGVLLLWSKG